MSLVARLSAEFLVEAPHHEHHGVWSGRPHHMLNVSPEKIQNVHLLEGEWGSVGSVIEWHFVIDGKDQIVKEVVESIDKENNAITFKVIGGYLLKEYKYFKVIFQSIPKGEATWMHWTVEYEKLQKDDPHPFKLIEFIINLSEDLDDHLVQT